MQRRSWTGFGPVLILSMFLLSGGCDGNGDGNGVSPTALFLIDLTNIWFEEGNPDHEFNIVPDQQGEVSSSTFTGEETTPDGDNFSLSGSFNNRDISFTVQRDTGDVTYSGEIVDTNRMVVSSGGETLTIVR